jgi:hypothetical protein
MLQFERLCLFCLERPFVPRSNGLITVTGLDGDATPMRFFVLT